MKYEDWMKYEEHRVSQVPLCVRVSLPVQPAPRPLRKAVHQTGERLQEGRLAKMLQRTWALIVQPFN